MSYAPGIYPELPFDEYRRIPAASASMIKQWQISKKRGKAYRDGKIKFDSDSMRLGRAEHSMICEEKEEEILVATRCCATLGSGDPCDNWGNKFDGDKWYCGVKNHAPSNAVKPADFVTEEEYEEIIEKREALRSHPCVAALKRASWAELTIVFDIDGVRFKGRLDKADLESPVPCILDLKRLGERPLSVDNANYVIAKRQYHVQAALYRMGVWELKQIDVPFLWIFVEADYPYDVLPMELRTEDSLKGQRKVEEFIEEYKLCLETDEWPGVWEHNRPALTSLPEWA